MANQSRPFGGKFFIRDFRNLRQAGARMEMHFDASHKQSEKPHHFDLALHVDERLMSGLCNDRMQETFYKLGFGTNHFAGVRTANRVMIVKYAIYAWEADLVRRCSRRREIEQQLAILATGEAGAMVKNLSW